MADAALNFKRIKPPRSLLTLVGQAIGDFAMIEEGDRILLGLSGGKDSLSLLHLLLDLQARAPVKFEIGAATVDPQSPDFDPSPLKDYVGALGVPYFYESFPILQQAKQSMQGKSFCAFCSRMRRGLLYGAARRENYKVLALAQHLDDAAETFLMSMFYGGKLRTMKASYTNDAGDIRIIRPLIYARERQTAAFAKDAGLPVIAENCPACFAMPMERMHMKTVLGQLEAGNKKLFPSLLTAMRPLLSTPAIDSAIASLLQTIMSLGSTLLGLISVLLMAWGQILFKMAGHTLQSPMQWQQWLSAPMIAAVVISSVATVLWIWVLRTTPLYIAYPLMALAFFFVPAGAYLMLNEPINNNTFIGAGLIIIGIVVSYL